MKDKVIILSEYIGENHNSTAYYWAQIVKSLHMRYEVLLVAPHTPHVIEFAKKYKVSLTTIKLKNYDKNSLFSRLWGQIRQTFSFMSVLSKEINSCQILFSGTNPIITMFAISIFRKLKRFRWVLLVHDIFPNNLVPARILNREDVLFRLLMSLSRVIYSTPDRLICIGRDMESLLVERIEAKSITRFIPNWASTDTIYSYPKNNNEIINSLGWEHNIVFQFFGNMGRLQGIYNLLNAIELTQDLNARFIFIGDGSELENTKKYIIKINEKAGYRKAHYYGQLALSDNLIGLNACDIAIVSLTNDMYGLGVPSKAYFSMAADKPIVYVGDKNSELGLLLAEYDIGWFCEPNDPAQLAIIMDEISSEYFMNHGHRLNPRNIMKNHFSEEMSLEKIVSVIDETTQL